MRDPVDDRGAPAADDEDVYGLVVAPSARRSTDGLPRDVVLAALELVDGPLRRRPRAVGAPLGAPFEGFWRARRGEHRIRYRIDERRRVVEVVSIDHRRDACRS